MATTSAPEDPRIVSARVSASARAELERRAREGDRTLSAHVRRAIAEHLEREEREKEDA